MNQNKSASAIRSLRRRFFLEQLETRALLAGNVTASVAGGNLIVRGDNDANTVLISEVDDGDGNSKTHAYVVGGLDTTIKGGLSVPAGFPIPDGVSARLFTKVTGNLDVDLRGSDDFFFLGNDTGNLANQLENCGFPADTTDALNRLEVSLPGQATVPRDLIVNMGNGANQVGINASARTAVITSGNGNDLVSVGTAPDQPGARFRDDLVILTGDGSDHVCTENLQVDDFLNVQLGNGNSNSYEAFRVSAGHILATAGKGSDDISIGEVATDREIVVDSGAGDDFVEMDAFGAGQGLGPKGQRNAGNVTVVTGNGNDHVSIFGDFQNGGPSGATSLLVDTGAGNDGVDIGRFGLPDAGGNLVLRNQLTVATGAGNDNVFVQGVSSTRGGAVIDTGIGNDTATLVGLLLQNDLVLALGAGVDEATLNTVAVGRNAVIDAGANDDTVTIQDSTVNNGRITVLMGAGNNDTLNITGSTAQKATLNGGPGNNDTLNTDLPITGNGKQGGIEVREFEHFNAITALNAADTLADITEGDASVSGNVLDTVTGGAGPVTVTAVAGQQFLVDQDVQSNDPHGTFHINADGSYTYTLDNADPAVIALNDDETLTDQITYTVSDGFVSKTVILFITIHGHSEMET